MDLVFLGGEVPSHRKLLEEAGVTNIGINYWRLVKRGLPVTKDYLISDKFDSNVRVWLYPGSNQVRTAKLANADLDDFISDYEDFLVLNDSNIHMASELEVMPPDMIQNERDNFWANWGPDRFLPVWGKGYPDLMNLSEEYPNVGILGTTIDKDLTLSGRVRAIKSSNQTTFHGIACANPSNLRNVPLASASTLAWISPMMRGETIVWDGTKLVRYQAKQKDEARPRYKSVIEQAGLDFDLIMKDDPNEVTKLAIYSYLKLEEHLTKMETRKLSDNSEYRDDPGDAETGAARPDNRVLEVRNEAPTVLPIFDVSTRSVVDVDAKGNTVITDVSIVSTPSSTSLQCNTCFVKQNCPAFKPDNNCAYDIPVSIKTKDQLKGLLNTIIEMQAKRVAFARFSEELNGGYPDPNTSKEIDRLFKIVGKMKELEENKEFIRITAERQTSGGVLSALFGEKAKPAIDLPQERDSSEILSEGFNF